VPSCSGTGSIRAYLGPFDTEVEAAQARDCKARELHGEFAYLNFPEQARAEADPALTEQD
jgi:hypothetical protein